MTDATRFQFNDPSVPKAYDELLVPRLFEPWAKLLLDEAGLQPGEWPQDIAPASSPSPSWFVSMETSLTALELARLLCCRHNEARGKPNTSQN